MNDAGSLDVKAFEMRLQELRAEVLRLEEESREGREPVELDQSKVGRLSRMDALQGQAMALALDQRRKVELQRIDAALMRIENDDFGYCVSCDEEIALKRLELDPATPTCISCAEK
ncbi:DnaK suppressor protein [Candidatus Terasakiella magnetica]|uniref:DnaK suppressor protein n=1 Tax=Candidatus Terasakiella magnetica TaxID=1867952 RepID=A0A1C3RLE0_9PROT|nr:TraR/DksA C4-type zinc finger protein [Candidatus Terasakiella magnetica]SCA58009.1 DnaK suppressor protein [Candidatus Terasakiella magnetica]